MTTREPLGARWCVALCLLVAALLLLGAPDRAAAQPEQLTPQQEETLADALEAGNNAFNRGFFDQAAEHYRAALEIHRGERLVYRLGLCYERMDDVPAAVQAYSDYLAEWPDSPIAGRVAADLKRLKARLAATLPHLEVITLPRGFEVRRGGPGGPVLGETPLRVPIKPGEHLLVMTREGYATITRTVTMEAGRDQNLTLQARVAEGALKVTSSPEGATVRLLGHSDNVIGETPLRHAIAPGEYTLHVTFDGRQSQTERVTVAAGEELELSYDLIPIQGLGLGEAPEEAPQEDGAPRRTAAAGWSLVISGGVVGLGAGGLWLWASDTIAQANDYDRGAPGSDRGEREALVDEAETLRLATWATGGVAAAAITTGLVLVLLDNSDAAPRGSLLEGITLAPTPDHQGGAVLWRGHLP